jgi:hypothetical protein
VDGVLVGSGSLWPPTLVCKKLSVPVLTDTDFVLMGTITEIKKHILEALKL